jgi:hypothetical protein
MILYNWTELNTAWIKCFDSKLNESAFKFLAYPGYQNYGQIITKNLMNARLDITSFIEIHDAPVIYLQHSTNPHFDEMSLDDILASDYVIFEVLRFSLWKCN